MKHVTRFSGAKLPFITCLQMIISQRLAAMLLVLCAFSVSAHAQVTSLTMVSDPGDYIGAGQFYFYTPADGTFSAQQNSAQGVSLAFNTPSYEHWWYLDFAAPNSQPLTVGTYAGAVRFPFQEADQPGLSVYGDGRGCNTLTGTFQVLEIAYGAANDIIAFNATFEQHCEGGSAALRGEIRYNANVTVNVTAPTHLTAIEGQNQTFTVSATDSQSRHVALTAMGLPSGAGFVDNGDNTGTFNWTPSSAQIGTYLLTFQGDNGQGGIAFAYTQMQVIATPPPNDDFSSATVVPAIPFTVSQDATNATVAPDDPITCYGNNQTVWFAYTPQSSMRLEANTFGTGYDTTLAVFTGTRGALSEIACNEDAGGTVNSRVRFDAVAGTTYYFRVSSLYPVPSASLVFNVLEAPPPFSFAATVAPFGSVIPRSGAVTLNGSVTCTNPAYVSISGEVKQMHGGVPINGYFNAFVPCNGVTPWSATVQSQAALFHGRSAALFTGGKAKVIGSASAYDFDTGEYKQLSIQADVTLRGKK
jgi:VCBS repeat-containing protein